MIIVQNNRTYHDNTGKYTSRKHSYIVLTHCKPHFYAVKLGFTGVYLNFLFSAQKHRLWVLAEAVLTSTHNLCFEQKYENDQNFSSERFQFLVVKFPIYLNRRVFVMIYLGALKIYKNST